MSQGLGNSYNTCCFYLKYFARCFDYKVILGLPSCKSESCRRYTCTSVLLVCDGEVGELVQPGGMWEQPWGLLCGNSGREELCMVTCHSCHIYAIWTSISKKVWGMLRSYQLGVAMQVTNKELFLQGRQVLTR